MHLLSFYALYGFHIDFWDYGTAPGKAVYPTVVHICKLKLFPGVVVNATPLYRSRTGVPKSYVKMVLVFFRFHLWRYIEYRRTGIMQKVLENRTYWNIFSLSEAVLRI